MVRTWKRLAAGLLATAMLASTLSVSAFAADAPAADAAQSQIVEPVKTTGEGDEIPGEGDVIPGEGDVIPGEGDETPGEGDETPGEGDEIPGEGDETPGEGDETPGEVDETPGEGDGFVLPEGYTEADLALLEADPATLSFANQLKQQELSDALNEAMGISVMSFGAPEYTIATAQDLKDFADSVNNNGNGYYNTTIKLTADIDLSSVCSATAGSWTPIGTLSNKFMGTFDGQNHTISNLYINGNVPVAGLFGYCAGSIKNLGVVNASITTSATSARVGVIVGDLSHISAYPAIIMENCYSTGTVQATANGAYAAGIAGYLYEATLKNCYSTVAVTAPSQSYAGGVIGRLSDSTLENCYSTGVVSGSTELGSYAGGRLL